MILIEPNRAGSMWLRAMFRLYCRKYDCTMVRRPKDEYVAMGKLAPRAEYAYEFAHSQLQIAIVNAIAKNDNTNRRQVIAATTRSFVKELYRRGEYSSK